VSKPWLDTPGLSLASTRRSSTEGLRGPNSYAELQPSPPPITSSPIRWLLATLKEKLSNDN